MLPKQELLEALTNFYGTEAYHRLVLGKLVGTDGVRFLAENAECFWLLDIIASYQAKCDKDDSLRYFQFWKLRVKDGKGVITCNRDAGDTAFTQEIPETGFPLDEIEIWVENGVMLLPSER